MALTVAQAVELPVAKSFRLAAGTTGLNRMIEKVNLLDFEYDTWEPEGTEPDGMFDEKAFVVTSMIFAKDAPDKILPVMKQLYANGISALAIKDVYYKELPKEALEFANEKSLPVFFFDSATNFSDNIVVSLTKAIEEYDDVEGQEEKVAFLLQDNLSIINRAKMQEELFPYLQEPFQFFYFLPKRMFTKFAYHHKVLLLRKKKKKGIDILPYQYGILVCVSDKSKQMLPKLMEYLELEQGTYYCGVSKDNGKIEESVYKIKESIYACNYTQIIGRDSSCFADMGIWQVILPNKENYWMKAYCDGIIHRLKSYDGEGSGEIYPTVVAYVKSGCDSGKTAEMMMVHKNTIRYRLGKARELLGMEDKPEDFNESIILAVYFKEGI